MKRKKAAPDWLRVSEETNALDYLKRVCAFALEAEEDKLAWKWVVIALHSALYGFAICACKGTANLAVVRETKKGPRLIGMNKALNLCQDQSYMRTLFGGKAIKLTTQQKESLTFLKDIRNQFEHYRPMLWSIAYQELPYHAMHVLDVIASLTETGTWCRPPEGFWEEVGSTIAKCRAILRHSKAHRAYEHAMRTGEKLKGDGQNTRGQPDLPEPHRRNTWVSCHSIFDPTGCERDPGHGRDGGEV